MSKIIFIGGIHGVGKGKICKELCSQTDFKHLVASDLIKIGNASDKRVSHLDENQDKLILGLKGAVKNNNNYLLDGHFSLMTKNGTIENIPIEVFSAIDNLHGIVVIANNPEIIQKGLKERDNKEYDIEFLSDFQDREIEHANTVGNALGIPVNEFWMSKDRVENLISFIQR